MTTLFSRAELLDQWLTRRGYQPLRTDVSTDITTGTDLAAHMGREVADWVRYVYATAPPSMLPVAEGSAYCTLTSVTSGGAARLNLPADAARVVAVRLTGWERAATPVLPGCLDDIAAGNPFLLPDESRPLAVMEPDGSMLLSPAGENCSIASLLYVPQPPGINEPVAIDPLLLATMSSFDPDTFNPFQT